MTHQNYVSALKHNCNVMMQQTLYFHNNIEYTYSSARLGCIIIGYKTHNRLTKFIHKGILALKYDCHYIGSKKENMKMTTYHILVGLVDNILAVLSILQGGQGLIVACVRWRDGGEQQGVSVPSKCILGKRKDVHSPH